MDRNSRTMYMLFRMIAWLAALQPTPKCTASYLLFKLQRHLSSPSIKRKGLQHDVIPTFIDNYCWAIVQHSDSYMLPHKKSVAVVMCASFRSTRAQARYVTLRFCTLPDPQTSAHLQFL